MKKTLIILLSTMFISCTGALFSVTKYYEPLRIIIIEKTEVLKGDNPLSGTFYELDKDDTTYAVGENSLYYEVKIDKNTYGYIDKDDAKIFLIGKELYKKYFTIDYDKFLNVYEYKLNEKLILRSKQFIGNQQDLSLETFTVTQKDSLPVSFSFQFVSTNPYWKYLNVDTIYLLCDGERIVLESLDKSSDVISGENVLEIIYAAVSPKQFYTIANAKVVEGRIGGEEFIINYQLRESYRSLYNYFYEE